MLAEPARTVQLHLFSSLLVNVQERINKEMKPFFWSDSRQVPNSRRAIRRTLGQRLWRRELREICDIEA